MTGQLSFTLGKGQSQDRYNVGIDMGKNKWVTDVFDTATGKHHRHPAVGPDAAECTYARIEALVASGREVDVIYEAGRNGFAPARRMTELGARVTVLPVNKLQVVVSGKRAKTDGIDARDLAELNSRAERCPRVWVPTVDEECRRRMVTEEDRLDKEVKRSNNRILSVIERWPLPSERCHRPATQWRKLVREGERPREPCSGGDDLWPPTPHRADAGKPGRIASAPRRRFPWPCGE